MNSFFTRNVIESALRLVGALVPSPQQTEFAPSTSTPIDYFDTTSMAKLPKKYYPGERVPDPLLVVHVTDITGGFGVSPKRVAWWRERLERALLDPNKARGLDELLEQLPPVPEEGPFPYPPQHPEAVPFARWLDEQAHRLALWERFGRTPYHWVAARNGDVIKNHPATRRTKHGNAGNRGVGVAIDVGHKEVLTEFVIETGRAAVRNALEDLVDELDGADSGFADDQTIVAPHRVFSGKRLVDTDARVWREIVLPVVKVTSWARIDYELVEGGRPIPRDWDENALFDSKGRRIKR